MEKRYQPYNFKEENKKNLEEMRSLVSMDSAEKLKFFDKELTELGHSVFDLAKKAKNVSELWNLHESVQAMKDSYKYL